MSMSADFLWPDKRFETLVGPVSRETGDKLHLYQSLLERWQKKVNLVSASTLPQVWSRHFLDSAQLIPHLPDHPVQIMDMGSGAGFPGLILAILTSHKLHLVESDTKKAIFLQEAGSEGLRTSFLQKHGAGLTEFDPNPSLERPFSHKFLSEPRAGLPAGPQRPSRWNSTKPPGSIGTAEKGV